MGAGVWPRALWYTTEVNVGGGENRLSTESAAQAGWGGGWGSCV